MKKDVYRDQARHFANLPLIDRRYIASVHLEDRNDKPFWNEMLQQHRMGNYYFIAYSRSSQDNETSGCQQCLKYRPYLSSRFFICIDSDMRFLMQHADLDAAHFVLQTYTYSWENHYCEAESLQCRTETMQLQNIEIFNFQSFLYSLSELLYRPLLLLTHCLKNHNNLFEQKKFNQCFITQCRKEDLLDDGAALIRRFKASFERITEEESLKSIDLYKEEETFHLLGITPQNAYLHVRGHGLYSLLLHISQIVFHDDNTASDFIASNDLSGKYWQINKVRDDIRSILQ